MNQDRKLGDKIFFKTEVHKIKNHGYKTIQPRYMRLDNHLIQEGIICGKRRILKEAELRWGGEDEQDYLVNQKWVSVWLVACNLRETHLVAEEDVIEAGTNDSGGGK